jgi:hypothetical protein
VGLLGVWFHDKGKPGKNVTLLVAAWQAPIRKHARPEENQTQPVRKPSYPPISSSHGEKKKKEEKPNSACAIIFCRNWCIGNAGLLEKRTGVKRHPRYFTKEFLSPIFKILFLECHDYISSLYAFEIEQCQIFENRARRKAVEKPRQIRNAAPLMTAVLRCV